MVLPSRRAVLLLAMLLAIAVTIGGAMLRPGSLSPVEQGLVGTWDEQRPSGQSKQAALVFEADRELRLTDGKLLGHWQVSGGKLVLKDSNTSYLGKVYSMLSGANGDDHELIIDAGGNSFTVKQLGGYDAVFTRSAAE